ncbi:hypothetical protein [Kineococcus aurantiacus]|uniref:Integral membrane protein n=1 Tax=Kineococcus aurantiacus TaxID=37633 RepID=A0A7Y9DJE3_9ACTN|nr:hypothetical protein [Kineococcus aurantiacus]NYD20608.1 hypothetical protein [Kineococcus aurantiacus]
MHRSPSPLLVAATVSYAANCALGAAVAAGVLDTSGARWVHHGVYVTTAALTAAAGADLLRRRSAALWPLLPVAAPLLAIPAVPARSRWHPVLAATAAPAYVLALRAA